MSYRISYGSEPGGRVSHERPKKRKNWMAAVVLAVALICLAGRLWGEQLILLLLPGEPEVTAQAIRHMVEAMQTGESVKAVFADFCLEILAYGNG